MSEMITPEKYASQLYAEAIDFTKSKKKAAEAARWALATLIEQSKDYGMLMHHSSGLKLLTFYNKALEEACKLG